MRAHGHNRGVGGVEVLSGSGMVELNLHAQARQNLLVVLDRAHDLVLARRRGRQHNLAAQMIARLVDGHVVTALGRHARGLQAGNTAAHHGDLLVASPGLMAMVASSPFSALSTHEMYLRF